MTDESHHIIPYDDANSACERAVAELRIYPGSLSPEFVTQQLGIEPTSSQRVGQVFRNSLGRERVAEINSWSLSTEDHCTSRELRRHLDWLLEKLMPAADALRALQRLPDMKMYVCCVWWSAYDGAAPVLWPQQMRKMATLNLECAFDVAFYGNNDEGDGKAEQV